MKTKRIVALVMVSVLCLFAFAACGKKAEANTIGTKLYEEFKAEAKNTTDAEELAMTLSESEIFEDIAMMSVPVEPGWVNGFDGDVTGFTKGAAFAPMIGTIPFVGYVFETDDAKALVAELKEKAMLNWNICTVADEMVVESSGNLVFFVMAPASFDE